MDPIKNKKLVLRGRMILELSKDAENINQLARRSGVTYPTLHRYITAPDRVRAIDLSVFGSMLSAGLGLSDESIKDIRLGDLFEIVENDRDP